MPKPRQRAKSQVTTREDSLVRSLDDLSDLEQFKAEILPQLRKMIRQGKKAEDFYSWAEAYLAARNITLALTANESTALGAIKEAMDRLKGKSTEKKEVVRKYEKMSDAELDALYKAQVADVDDEDIEGDPLQ